MLRSALNALGLRPVVLLAISLSLSHPCCLMLLLALIKLLRSALPLLH